MKEAARERLRFSNVSQDAKHAHRGLFASPFFTRHGLESHLKNSGLPGAVQSTILSVVQTTGLYRVEKAEICDELIAHFEDGHMAGATHEELLNNFGDVAVVANLIGRSKKRNRSLFMKIGRTLGYVGLGTIALILRCGFISGFGKPNPNIDFMVDLNRAALAVTDESQKAWPIYRETWIKYDVLKSPENKRHSDIFFARRK